MTLQHDSIRTTAKRNSLGQRVRDAVFEPHGAPVNRALIAAQVVVFAGGLYLALTHKISLADYLSTGRSPLFEYLLVSPARLARGDWWVLFTSAFVHLGWLHLVVNLVSMAALGPTVEGMLGSRRYLLLWFISALGGSTAVALWNQSAGGSSGVICGLIGAQAAFFALYHPHVDREVTAGFREWLIKTVFIITVLSLIPWVSGAAHLGGGIAGGLVGGLLAIHRFGRPILRGPALAGVFIVVAFAVGLQFERGILGSARTPQQIATLEFNDFTNRIRPQVDRLETAADATEDNVVAPLRALRPERRPREQVVAAIGELQKLRSEHSQLLTMILQTGHYRTAAAELSRRAAGNLVEQRMRAAILYEECLRRGDQWALETDENLLQTVLNVALEADITYRQAARRVLALRTEPPNPQDPVAQ